MALAQNPTIKEAEIKIQQADTVRRLAKSEYMPDIGASFHYLSPFGVNFVPTNIMGWASSSAGSLSTGDVAEMWSTRRPSRSSRAS